MHKHKNDIDVKDMTLRDQFAALAMQSLIQIGAVPPKSVKRKDGSEFDDPSDPYYFGDDLCEGKTQIGYDAYGIANAMLAAREATKPEIPSLEGIGPIRG